MTARGGIGLPTQNACPYGMATTAVFDASFANYSPTSTAYWFVNCHNLTSITNIEYLNTANVTKMNEMFAGCEKLTSLDLSHFDTSNVTDMYYMFQYCSALTSLDLSSFNTANVTSMYYMFFGCSALTSLDLSNFNTANVTDMSCMFQYCTSLTSLDLSGFNTANVQTMYSMFSQCSELKTIYTGNEWSTDAIINVEYMFDGCTNLVGGAGTHFDDNHTDHTYAHIDGGTTNPGYFTAAGQSHG